MRILVYLSATLFFAYLGTALAGSENAMTSEQWATGALNAALCDKPPCSPQSLESLIGPMRTEQEWRTLAEQGDSKAQSQQCSAHGFKNDVDPQYYRKIVRWCRSDAEQGSVQGEYLLAKLRGWSS